MLKRLFQLAPVTKSGEPENLSGLLSQLYQDRVKKNYIQYDDRQVLVLKHLQDLMEKTVNGSVSNSENHYLNKLLPSMKEGIKSLYIFGGVGSGKSMLMDLFFDACPIENKRRVHFHAFMQETHAFIHHWRQNHDSSPLPALADKIRQSAVLLCFDEFDVNDIADAMILGRLFTRLLDLGVVFVITSNRHPDDLYLGGLQRDLFLPFIEILKNSAEVLHLQAEKDYRLIHLNSLEQTYYYPLNHEADDFLQFSFDELTCHAHSHQGILHVLGREVTISAVHDKVAFAAFEELCERPLGAADYLEIARNFRTLLISRIPQFFPENRNEAKRFVILVDVLYEHKVKLICTAEVPIMELYTEGDGTFEFKRTASRLVEMQSESYLSSPHVLD